MSFTVDELEEMLASVRLISETPSLNDDTSECTKAKASLAKLESTISEAMTKVPPPTESTPGSWYTPEGSIGPIVEASGPEVAIMGALAGTSASNPKRTVDIAKQSKLGSTRKSVNKYLYAMQREGLIGKISDAHGAKPRWYFL